MITIILIVAFFMGLAWGSFLNVIAYRVLHHKKLLGMRSKCPHCNHVIAWYDNIPIISWIALRGSCRYCKSPISFLYLLIEVITASVITQLVANILIYQGITCVKSLFILHNLWHGVLIALLPNLIFFSALICAVRTDLESLLIPQWFSLFLVPLGWIFSFFGLLNISLLESLIGSVIGYGILWVIAFVFKYCTHKEGMGQGDMDLLALIGAFLGPMGVWISLMIASLIGVIIGSIYLYCAKKTRDAHIPFGPFLSFGAIAYALYQKTIFTLLFAI